MPAMGKFLQKLQVYKSIGDYDSGKKMFDSYSQFDETWIRWREIIIAKQQPRRAVVQANSFIEGTVRDIMITLNTKDCEAKKVTIYFPIFYLVKS